MKGSYSYKSYASTYSVEILNSFKPKLQLKGALSGLIQFLAIESPFKIMKTAFYFTSKLFSFSRHLNFYLDVSVK